MCVHAQGVEGGKEEEGIKLKLTAKKKNLPMASHKSAFTANPKTVYRNMGIIPPVSMSSILSEVKNYAEYKLSEEISALHLPDLHELAAGGKKNVRKISGDEVWTDVYTVINQIFPECWLEQAKIVEALVAVNVRRIYGAELDLVMDRLLKDNNWNRSIFCNLTLIICPRRFGKTRATEVVAAALLLCVPGFNHVHFALQKKFGVDFVSNVLAIIKSTERGRAMLTHSRQNKEEILLRGPAGDQRRLRSLTSDSNVCIFFPLPPPSPLPTPSSFFLCP